MQSTLYYCSERGFSINLHHISANYATAGNKKILRDPPKNSSFPFVIPKDGRTMGGKEEKFEYYYDEGGLSYVYYHP